MELMVKKVEWELDNHAESDTGMNSVFFHLDKGYFMIARTNDDDEVYLELNDHENGECYKPNIFDIDFKNGKLSLKINLENKSIVNYLKRNKKQAGMYEQIILSFKKIEDNKFVEIMAVLKIIFPDSNEYIYNTATGKKIKK
jgi:hypothetical protein